MVYCIAEKDNELEGHWGACGRSPWYNYALSELWCVLFVFPWLAPVYDRRRVRSRSYPPCVCRPSSGVHAVWWRSLFRTCGGGWRFDVVRRLQRPAGSLPRLRTGRWSLSDGAAAVRPV